MACYANPDPMFQKAMRLIASITNAQEATVTTTFDHQYIPNMFVRIRIPSSFGMQQLNGQQVLITSVPTDTTFTIDVDTLQFDTFAPPGSPTLCAQVIPIGAFATLDAATINVL